MCAAQCAQTLDDPTAQKAVATRDEDALFAPESQELPLSCFDGNAVCILIAAR